MTLNAHIHTKISNRCLRSNTCAQASREKIERGVQNEDVRRDISMWATGVLSRKTNGNGKQMSLQEKKYTPCFHKK